MFCVSFASFGLGLLGAGLYLGHGLERAGLGLFLGLGTALPHYKTGLM